MTSFPYNLAPSLIDNLAKALGDAFAKVRGRINESALQQAIRTNDANAIREALGIFNGQWLALSQAITDAITSAIAAPAEDVFRRTLTDLGASPEQTNETRTSGHNAALPLIQSAHDSILAESLDGIEAAIALTVKDEHGSYTDAALLLLAIGLTRKQAVLLYGATHTATALSWKMAGFDDERSRREIATNFLATVPALIAAPAKRYLKAHRHHMTATDVERLQKQTARILFDHRMNPQADFTARTAIEDAQSQAWSVALTIGLIGIEARKHWVTMGDELVRHTHAAVEALNPQGVPVDGLFQTPLGEVSAPPLERNCRCRTSLRVGYAIH